MTRDELDEPVVQPRGVGHAIRRGRGGGQPQLVDQAVDFLVLIHAPPGGGRGQPRSTPSPLATPRQCAYGSSMRPIVTLLTDFGTADGYVAQIKGVMLSHAPDIAIVDITHDIAPQDVVHARFVVERYWQPVSARHHPRGGGRSWRGLATRGDRRLLRPSLPAWRPTTAC